MAVTVQKMESCTLNSGSCCPTETHTSDTSPDIRTIPAGPPHPQLPEPTGTTEGPSTPAIPVPPGDRCPSGQPLLGVPRGLGSVLGEIPFPIDVITLFNLSAVFTCVHAILLTPHRFTTPVHY